MMRGSSLLLLLTFAACAELSGLKDLTTSDAGFSTNDAASDATIVPDIDANPIPQDSGTVSDAATSFCLGLVSSSYAFCADFDEGSATMGFDKGIATPWPMISLSPPTLTMLAPHSPPASGSFIGSSNQGLGYQTKTIPTAITFSAEARVDKLADQMNSIVVVQTSSSSAIMLTFARSTTDTKQFIAHLDDVTLGSDGGPTLSSPHPFAGAYDVGVWHSFVLTMNIQMVVGTLDNTDVVSFPTPSQGNVPNVVIEIGYSQTGWTGSFDDVYFKLK